MTALLESTQSTLQTLDISGVDLYSSQGEPFSEVQPLPNPLHLEADGNTELINFFINKLQYSCLKTLLLRVYFYVSSAKEEEPFNRESLLQLVKSLRLALHVLTIRDSFENGCTEEAEEANNTSESFSLPLLSSLVLFLPKEVTRLYSSLHYPILERLYVPTHDGESESLFYGNAPNSLKKKSQA